MSYLLKPSFILRYEKDCLVLKIHKREKIYYVFYLKKKSNSKMQINPKLHLRLRERLFVGLNISCDFATENQTESLVRYSFLCFTSWGLP